MSKPQKQMHINLFIQGVGHHEAAWRHPNTDPANMLDISYYQRLAKQAEDAKFDSIFIADGLAINPNIEFGPFNNFYEPFTLLAAIAGVTEYIGLIGTASTTYEEPYHAARKFASLDHVSRGRAGWNIVTTGNELSAKNFGLDQHVEHSKRYVRATEFLEVTTKLWDSWEDDALIFDREAGTFIDSSKVREINHSGEIFKVRGPIDIPRPPQGYPVLVQAGSSEDGKEFAAHYAEAIYTAQDNIHDAKQFYTDVKGRMGKYGRTPEQLCILPGLAPIIGNTEAEAKEKVQEINEYIVPQYALRALSKVVNVDLFTYPLDGPLPELPSMDQINGGKSRFKVVIDIAKREKYTIRQLIQAIAFGRGHNTFAGTPEQIADHMEEWFTNEACDGFNFLPPHLPGDMEQFTKLVIPILQKRGLFRTEYSGRTLRDHFGLSRPVNQFNGVGVKS
ncbi:LLM class flavin-dependent oxidoreductase [Metabacillus halosaccharovorans]|uniref:NtaA/DmoA family FMN-dependent monooxygenase n=1 Tax=Metabacillus halosaccharovorans TaxID=930124 RepID=UPI00403D81E2